MKLKKRILSLLLCGAMLFSLCSQSVLAEENGQAGGVTIGTSGLCEHHPEHNADCGYTEGTAGTPCNHEHTEDCYTLVTECVHEHDEDCYPEESVSGNEATPSGAQKREPTECTHACSEESGCITKELNCQHEHDDECGYSPAAEGTPCGYVCELCGAGDNTPSNAEAVTVASVQAMINALPSAEAITEENAEEVKAQLEAIDEAKEKLSDEEIDELDMTRYAEAAAALGALAAPMILANDSPDEQFFLKPGDTYYFDLSGEDIPGTANSGNSDGAVSLPDTSLHYVPFTYVGTIEAYKLTSATVTTEEYAQQNKYPHSLFVADYAVTHTVSWDDLNTKSLIFGKNYASGGVDYTLRAPSVGSNSTGSGESQHDTPSNNEWDRILDKNSGYIQNWNKMYSWGQDTSSAAESFRALRGYYSARRLGYFSSSLRLVYLGFRPVLEVLNPGTLGSGGLKVVTLDLGGGKLGGSSEDIQIIVKNGSEFTAPASDGMTRPDGDAGSFFMWLGSDGKRYAPGASVPAEVTTLTVQWTVPTYAVTLNTNGGTINNGNVTGYTYGVGATLPTDVTRTGYTFKGWYDNENLTGSPVTAISNTETGNKEYWAKWEANTYPVTFYPTGGSSSSEDRDDPSGNAFITDRPNKDNPTTPTTAKSNSVKVDSKGNAVITRSIVADVISVAQSDSIKHGNTKNGIAVVVPVEISKALAGVQITLKADALDKLVSSGVKRFTIDTDSMADFGFMLDTLKELNRQTTGDLILKMKKTAVTSQEVETAIGNRPVYDITLWEVKNGKETAVNLSGKTVSIAIPYTPAKNEQPGNLYAVYVDENGNVQWISKSSYNMDQKAVIFVAEHFSIYGIGYKNQIPAFTDVNNHWAKDNMLFVVSRGLLSGTSATTFSPNTGMTRGMFVTALGRLAGVDPTDYQASMFTDVKEDAYYAPYVNWAAKTGVVSGTTDTAFAPDTNINREQMAVIMKNYATKLGYTIPKTLEAVTFADNAQISSWAKDAVKSMQQAGILAGKTNNCFDPAGTATRAEVATVLRRFVEIVIDPQTANGWVQNDSGEWSYYKNGDLVKGWLSNDQKWYWLDKNTGKMFSGGWKQIDGKQYYFYADGSMAVNTTVDGKTIGADGARK